MSSADRRRPIAGQARLVAEYGGFFGFVRFRPSFSWPWQISTILIDI
jgi:hypothetical protein